MNEVLKQVDLNKVSSIVNNLEETGRITPKKAQELCGKSEATTRRYLRMLVETGYVIPEGNTNNTIYRINYEKIELLNQNEERSY